MAQTQTDSSGQPYREFPMSKDERVRVTYVERAEWAAGEPTIRIQKRDHNGRTVFGPEFPADRALDLIAAISELVRENRKQP